MKNRYLPIIIDNTGKEYTNVSYKNLCDAVDALKDFVNNFSNGNDHKIVDAYVLNKVTGKQIRP